jgi:hypothetical protein
MINNGTLSDTVLTVFGLDSVLNYFWRVLAENTGVISDWSTVIKFATGEISSIDKEQNEKMVNTFELDQNYPNPFNTITTIRFQIPVLSKVTVKVYNATGQLVKTLVTKQMQAGTHKIEWDSTDERGLQVGSGLYFYRIQAGERSMEKKMMFIK